MKTKWTVLVLALSTLLQNSWATDSGGRLTLSLTEHDAFCEGSTMWLQSFEFLDKPKFDHKMLAANFKTSNECYRALFRILDSAPKNAITPYTSKMRQKTGSRLRGNCDGPHGCWWEDYTYETESIAVEFEGINFASEMP